MSLPNIEEMQMQEGTWTPELGTIEGAKPTVTYNTRIARYKKIGRLVFVNFFISGNITKLNGTNNYALISGLPFKAKTINLGGMAISKGICYNALAENREVTFVIEENTIRIQTNNGTGSVKWGVTGGTFQIGGSGVYEVN